MGVSVHMCVFRAMKLPKHQCFLMRTLIYQLPCENGFERYVRDTSTNLSSTTANLLNPLHHNPSHTRGPTNSDQTRNHHDLRYRRSNTNQQRPIRNNKSNPHRGCLHELEPLANDTKRYRFAPNRHDNLHHHRRAWERKRCRRSRDIRQHKHWERPANTSRYDDWKHGNVRHAKSTHLHLIPQFIRNDHYLSHPTGH